MSETRTMLGIVWRAIADKKGEDIVVLDVRGISSFTDFFVICNGTNPRQNKAICDEVLGRLKRECGCSPAHLEGRENSEWILMDYLNFVVHVFSENARGFYKLERLWSDAVGLEPEALRTGS